MIFIKKSSKEVDSSDFIYTFASTNKPSTARLSQKQMRTFNFIGDTTYTTREGISYRIDNEEHNIQRVGKSWVVDGKASSLAEMVKMGIAKKI